MKEEACKGCIKKAEGTGCDPKSFCQCSQVGNFGDSSFQQISRKAKELPLPDYSEVQDER